MAYFQTVPIAQHTTVQYYNVQAQAPIPQHNADDEDFDWGNLILDIMSMNERLAPPAPGVIPQPIRLRLPFNFAPAPVPAFSYGAQLDFAAQEHARSAEAFAELVDWPATLGDLPPVPEFALVLPMPMVNFGDGFAGPFWLSQPPPMPTAPSAVRLGKRERENRVSEVEEENIAGPSRLAAMAAPRNIGLAAQSYNTFTQFASSRSTDDRDSAESTNSNDELEVPAWVTRIDAIALAPWTDTLFANRRKAKDGWKVACLVCGRSIGASERTTSKGFRERSDLGHEHRARVHMDRAHRLPCAGMTAIGASYQTSNRMRTGYKYDGLERLALALVRRYPMLLDSQFQHGQMGTILHGDLKSWLKEPHGQRLLRMRAQNPSADLRPAIDRMAAALEA